MRRKYNLDILIAIAGEVSQWLDCQSTFIRRATKPPDTDIDLVIVPIDCTTEEWINLVQESQGRALWTPGQCNGDCSCRYAFPMTFGHDYMFIPLHLDMMMMMMMMMLMLMLMMCIPQHLAVTCKFWRN